MNATRHVLLFAVVSLIACGFCGCVFPEPISPTVLNRYQKTMAQRGPQARGEQPNSLNALKPPTNLLTPGLPISQDESTGRAKIELTLQQAVLRTLANNPDIQVISFDPAIAREAAIKEAAAFDWAVTGGFGIEQNKRNVDDIVGGGDAYLRKYNAGLKQKTITGATQSIGWTMTRTWDNLTTRTFRPAWEQNLVYQLEQPLLRDAWPNFNLAQLRIAQVNTKISAQQFRQKVEETVSKVISAYWTLYQARLDMAIQQRLLEITRQTYERVKGRGSIDATKVQTSQTLAAVSSREATLIQAAKAIRDAEDNLAHLMSDGQINLVGDYELIPLTPPVTELVHYTVTDQLLTGLEYSPTLEQARLAIRAAAIQVEIASNQTLPRLDLKSSAGYQGLGESASAANNDFDGGHYFSYGLGLQFEYPLGNRAAEAELRSRRYGVLKSISQMQAAADQLAQTIRERIRQIESTHEEMLAQQKVVQANRDQLEALEATERHRGVLSPEFLQVKLQAQESLAQAARSELAARVNYNKALADLSEATGTIMTLQGVEIALPMILGEQDWPMDRQKPMWFQRPRTPTPSMDQSFTPAAQPDMPTSEPTGMGPGDSAAGSAAATPVPSNGETPTPNRPADGAATTTSE